MATHTKRAWERPSTRPLTTSDGRADVADVPATNGGSISVPN